MADGPVRIGVAALPACTELVTEADVLVVVEVCEHAVSRFEQRGCGATHGAAKHAYNACHIRASLRRAVQKGSDERLI
eukprot:4387763-Pleurochrysis_carterae.AAC.1